MPAMPKACPECGAAGGEPHVQPCSYHQWYEVACGPQGAWHSTLPSKCERLKARAATDAATHEGSNEERRSEPPLLGNPDLRLHEGVDPFRRPQ